MKTIKSQYKHHIAQALVNDHHSCLNPTHVSEILTPKSLSELQCIIKEAARKGQQISIAGGRHAMGGQQFLTDGLLVDMTSLNKVISFDRQNGTIEVESGIMWPALIDYLKQAQAEDQVKWDDRAEADWMRSPIDRWCFVSKRSWPRIKQGSDCFRRPRIQYRHARWLYKKLQPRVQRRAVQPCYRWIWYVRND